MELSGIHPAGNKECLYQITDEIIPDWKNTNVTLMVVLDEKSGYHHSIWKNPRAINVCPKSSQTLLKCFHLDHSSWLTDRLPQLHLNFNLKKKLKYKFSPTTSTQVFTQL